MAAHRHLQNSVDAAAMAGASDLSNGLTEFEAVFTAEQFVKSHHDLANAKVDVFAPPTDGPYAGEDGYVEVIAEYETPTIFIQMLGDRKSRTAKARAVAGAELNDILDGIIALDHRTGAPGLAVTGNAQLSSSGRIIVNSENGGVDEHGDPVSNQPGFAAFVSPFAAVKADEVYVVGGVNRADRFQSIDGGPGKLRTGELPVPDPLRHLPVPTTANGVLNVNRGAPVATFAELQLNNSNDDSNRPNYIETDDTTGGQVLVLHPGIYSSINITGGRVRFRPGIYAIAASREAPYGVQILDGEIEANGIMFYNTREGYDPGTGHPDAFDGSGLPEADGANTGQIRINAALGFSGIDTLQHDYGEASPSISQYNGMLIFQRRRNIATIQIQGFSTNKTTKGAIYAKWARLRIPAGGTLNSQIVVGAISVPGHGNLFVQHESQDKVQSLAVFLVE